MRMNMDCMDKISMKAIMRAAKGFENFNIFMIHTVLEYSDFIAGPPRGEKWNDNALVKDS